MNQTDDVSPDQPIPPESPAVLPKRTIRQIDSQQLMQGDREILIYHNGEPYRLSVTRNGKLILHK